MMRASTVLISDDLLKSRFSIVIDFSYYQYTAQRQQKSRKNVATVKDGKVNRGGAFDTFDHLLIDNRLLILVLVDKKSDSDHSCLSKPSLYSQGGYAKKFPTLSELVSEGMWWAVRNLIRRRAARQDEFGEQICLGTTAAEWADYYGLLALLQEINHYVSRGITSGTPDSI